MFRKSILALTKLDIFLYRQRYVIVQIRICICEISSRLVVYKALVLNKDINN